MQVPILFRLLDVMRLGCTIPFHIQTIKSVIELTKFRSTYAKTFHPSDTASLGDWWPKQTATLYMKRESQGLREGKSASLQEFKPFKNAARNFIVGSV